MNTVQISYAVFAELLRKHNITPYRVYKETGVPQSSLSEWKRGNSMPKHDKIVKIADYFNVTVDYLLTGEQKTPAETGEREIKDDDIKIALFGGDSEVTDEMWDEALFAVQLIKERHKREKEKNG